MIGTGSGHHLHVEVNRKGRDFVAGDVHGMFRALERALEACGFDPARDRLLSVGDLVDRGSASEEALEWLESGRVHAATLGNHEAMMLAALGEADAGTRARARRRGLNAEALWRDNGGWWWDRRERGDAERRRWCRALGALPLAITLETAHGPVGIVHALPCPGPWSETVRRCAIRNDHKARAHILWGTEREPARTWHARTRTAGAHEPRAIVGGHFPVDAPRASGRVVHIDTGAGLDIPGARVTLACVSNAPVTVHSSTAGDARAWTPPAGDGTAGTPAPAPWLVMTAMRAIAQWWRGREPERKTRKRT